MVNLPLDVPVNPDGPTAQQWLIDELSKPVYRAAMPTAFDRAAKAVQDWLNSLTIGTVSGPPALGIGVILALVVAAIVVAFLVFGLPRLNRRSAVSGSLFGDDDERDAASIRRAAQEAARLGDYSTAVMEQFRAIARSLTERTAVTTSPGTTATGFAREASLPFPDFTQGLATAAVAFDEVRYLGRDGTDQQYQQLAALDRELTGIRPQLTTFEPVT